jgi:uncharacterized protein
VKLLVAIHDVTPAFEAEVRALWAMCAERSIAPALFVVPNWHGEWPLARHAAFTRWLRAREAEGAEVFVHGERHDEAGIRRGVIDHMRAFGHTDREGEFLTLDANASRMRIQRGLRTLRAAGLRPIGFVAPAWLWRRADCLTAAIDAGLRFSEDAGAVYLHDRGMSLPSPVLRWSARTDFRANASAVVMDLQSWRHRHNWLVRIALHPGDVRHRATSRSVERALNRWASVRSPWRYASL